MGNEKARAELRTAVLIETTAHVMDYGTGRCCCGFVSDEDRPTRTVALNKHRADAVLDAFLVHPDALIDVLVESGALEPHGWTPVSEIPLFRRGGT